MTDIRALIELPDGEYRVTENLWEPDLALEHYVGALSIYLHHNLISLFSLFDAATGRELAAAGVGDAPEV